MWEAGEVPWRRETLPQDAAVRPFTFFHPLNLLTAVPVFIVVSKTAGLVRLTSGYCWKHPQTGMHQSSFHKEMSRKHGTDKRSNLCSNTWLSFSCFDVTGWATCSMAWMRTLQWGTPSSAASSRWRLLVTPSPSSPLTLIRYVYSPRLTGITYSKHCQSDIVYFFALSCRDSKKKKDFFPNLHRLHFFVSSWFMIPVCAADQVRKWIIDWNLTTEKKHILLRLVYEALVDCKKR